LRPSEFLTALVSHFFVSHSEFVILDCDTCHIPMAVWKQHGVNPPETVVEQMKKKAKELFGDAVTFRMKMRKIPSHYHFHIIHHQE